MENFIDFCHIASFVAVPFILYTVSTSDSSRFYFNVGFIISFVLFVLEIYKKVNGEYDVVFVSIFYFIYLCTILLGLFYVLIDKCEEHQNEKNLKEGD